MPQQHKNLLALLLKATVLLLLCAYYMPHLTRTIRYDEAFTYIQYARSPLTALFVYTAPNNHLLNSLFVWISTNLIGNSVIGIRLPAFIAGMLALAYQYRLTKRLFKNDYVAFMAVFLTASMPVIADHMVNGRGYTLSVLLTLMYVDYIFSGNIALIRSSGWTLLTLTILLVITLPTMLLLIIPLMIWVAYQAYQKRDFDYLLTQLMPMIFGSVIGTLFYSRFSDVLFVICAATLHSPG